MTKQSQNRLVFLFVGMFGGDDALFEKASLIMQRRYGRLIKQSSLFDFTHTDYYTDEMGGNLRKMFFVFEKPILPERIIDIKLYTIKLESRFSIKSKGESKRRINLDPGYFSQGKVVLATHKDYSHRLYLGRGIYGEVTLFFKDKTFQPFPWTYPDYCTPQYINFFNDARKICYNIKK